MKKTIHLELIYMTVKLCKTHHFIKIFSSISSIMFISFLSFIDFALQSTEVWNNLSIVNTRCWSLWFNYPLGSRSRHVSFPEQLLPFPFSKKLVIDLDKLDDTTSMYQSGLNKVASERKIILNRLNMAFWPCNWRALGWLQGSWPGRHQVPLDPQS